MLLTESLEKTFKVTDIANAQQILCEFGSQGQRDDMISRLQLTVSLPNHVTLVFTRTSQGKVHHQSHIYK